METKEVDYKNGHVIKYKIIDGTAYHMETPDEVVNVLERARRNKTRIKIHLGDVLTGRDWNEEHDVIGYVSRSFGGEIRIPILVYNQRSHGGGGLLDHCIVKIVESKGGKVLYQRHEYKTPVIEVVENPDPEKYPEYTHCTIIDGSLYGRHRTQRSAENLKKHLLK
jgi:hypothetical protein